MSREVPNEAYKGAEDIGTFMLELESGGARVGKVDYLRVALSFKGYETIMVLTQYDHEEACKMVAFFGAGDVAGCVRKARGQFKDGTVKWQRDKYA